MLRRLDEVGLSLTELAKLTGDSYRNVQNWMAGTTIPAAFVARYVEHIPVNVEWLITGRGLPEPVDESTALRVYGILSRVIDAAEKDPASLEEAEALFNGWVKRFFEPPNGEGPGGTSA